MFRPLQELENLAPGTWYVNVLAVLPAFRNLGLGSGLLQRAEETARAGSLRGLSIIVSDSNGGDRKSVVSGKSVSVRVDLGGRRIIKKQNKYSTSDHKPTPNNNITYNNQNQKHRTNQHTNPKQRN